MKRRSRSSSAPTPPVVEDPEVRDDLQFSDPSTSSSEAVEAEPHGDFDDLVGEDLSSGSSDVEFSDDGDEVDGDAEVEGEGEEADLADEDDMRGFKYRSDSESESSAGSGGEDLNDENILKLASFLQRNDAPSDLSSDEDEVHNTRGSVPSKWYADEPHVGYDLAGRRLDKRPGRDAVQDFLDRADDPNYWRTLYDAKNDREVILTARDLAVIRRLKSGHFADATVDPTPDTIELDDPLTAKTVAYYPPPRARFAPSHHERLRVLSLLRRLRRGRLRPSSAKPPPSVPSPLHPRSQYSDLWADPRVSHRSAPLRAPSRPPPGHGESYRPPREFLPTAYESARAARLQEEKGRRYTPPTRHGSLREVPAHAPLLAEAYERCVSLALVPRREGGKGRRGVQFSKARAILKGALAELPDAETLRPWPSEPGIVYGGGRGRMRAVAVSACGEWVAGGGDEWVLRVWEVRTGRCVGEWGVGSVVHCVAWVGGKGTLVVGVDAGEVMLVDARREMGRGAEVDSEVEKEKEKAQTEGEGMTKEEEREGQVMKAGEREEGGKAASQQISWGRPLSAGELTTPAKFTRLQAIHAGAPPASLPLPPALSDSEDDEEDASRALAPARRGRVDARIALCVRIGHPVARLSVHRHADYFAAVCPRAGAAEVSLHQLSRRRTQLPFGAKAFRAQVQDVGFHPTKAQLAVVAQRRVALVDLQRQKRIAQLRTSAKWMSCVAYHPGGEHMVVGTFDSRVLWYEPELRKTPFRTLRFHRGAVRAVRFHERLPLFASASDDGSVYVYHHTVFDDLVTDARIVPLHRIRAVRPRKGLGVMDIAFHPTLPWLFVAGVDGFVRLYTHL